MSKRILHNLAQDGVDRRGFLECMAWAGTGLLWTVSGGLPSSKLLGQTMAAPAGFSFVQISDSHIGFNKPANPDVTATLQVALDRINALPIQPDFIIHTGDLTHLAKPVEFDGLDQALKSLRQKQVFYVPGEHDTSTDDGQEFLARFGKSAKGTGWYSFDHKGVHFVGLVNVMHMEGMGQLGGAQLGWLADDLAAISNSTPVVVFAHIPLWTVYPEWGWGTQDSEQALALLRRFGSVTVLNGHIHQTMQKVEGHITFHTAMSTAFPQPAPGQAAAPGPMKVPAGKLQDVLGVVHVSVAGGSHSLAVVDQTLAAELVR